MHLKNWPAKRENIERLLTISAYGHWLFFPFRDVVLERFEKFPVDLFAAQVAVGLCPEFAHLGFKMREKLKNFLVTGCIWFWSWCVQVPTQTGAPPQTARVWANIPGLCLLISTRDLFLGHGLVFSQHVICNTALHTWFRLCFTRWEEIARFSLQNLEYFF